MMLLSLSETREAGAVWPVMGREDGSITSVWVRAGAETDLFFCFCTKITVGLSKLPSFRLLRPSISSVFIMPVIDPGLWAFLHTCKDSCKVKRRAKVV